MNVTILPINKTLYVLPTVLSIESVRNAVSLEAGVYWSQILLFYFNGDTNKMCMVQTTEELISTPIYALFHLLAGGKGGFRKQLEKKGREFSSAKRKEKLRKKNISFSQEERIQEFAQIQPRPLMKSTARKDSVKPEVRDLVRQGVEFVKNKYGGA